MSAHCAIVYTIKAHDSVFGAKSQDLRNEILKQIPGNSKKTRQLYSTLNLAIEERKEVTVNTRTQDGVKKVQGMFPRLNNFMNKPCCITGVQFDRADVG